MYQKKCPVCNAMFECHKHQKAYCSKRCYDIARNARHNKRRHDAYFGEGTREDVLKRDGYQCTMCGAITDLVVHHKDGSGTTDSPNNDMTNLVTLCAKCHSALHHPEESVYVTCPICGKEFKTISSRLQDGRGKYCSKACTDIGKKTNPNITGRPVRSRRTVECQICGKSFETVQSAIDDGKGKYCSRECFYQSRIGSKIPNRKPNTTPRLGRVTTTCQLCGKEFETVQSVLDKGKGKYCSRQCSDHARWHNKAQ